MKPNVAAFLVFALALAIFPQSSSAQQNVVVQNKAGVQNGPLRSAPVAGRWFISPNVGFDTNVGGVFVNDISGTSVGSSTFLGQALSNGLDVSVSEQSFSNAFNTPFHVGVEIGYGINKSNEAAIGFRWAHAGSKDIELAKVNGTGTMGSAAINGSKTLTGRFDDYQEYGVSGIYRHYFMQSGQFRPFFSGNAGLKYTPKIQFSANDSSLGFADYTFYDSGWVWSAGFGLGFRWDINPSISFGLEGGLNYTSDLNRSTKSDPDAIGGFNQSGERFDLPLTMSFLVRF